MPVLTQISSRWNDIEMLQASVTDLNGDLDQDYTLPAGFGDCAIMEIYVRAEGFATLITTPELVGVGARVLTTNSSAVVDIIGVSRWTRTGGALLAAYLSPDPLVLWRQNEVVRLQSWELDSDGAPTIDVHAHFKVVKVKPVESAALGPLQLVR